MPVATPAATLGAPCPPFALPDVFGVERLREEVLGGKANLVVFFCNHCPYAKAVEDRLIALHRAFSAEGLRTVFICANDAAAYPDDAPAALRARAEDKAYPFPSLIDERQDIAKAFDAACTPDPYLYDANLKLVYRGRIDDNWKRPDAVTKHELRNAIEAVLSGAPVETLQHPSLGCSIKWKAA